MKKRERDIETWKDIVLEIERLLRLEPAAGAAIRSWLVDQLVELGLDAEGDE